MPKQPMWRRYLRFWGPDPSADVRAELETPRVASILLIDSDPLDPLTFGAQSS